MYKAGFFSFHTEMLILNPYFTLCKCLSMLASLLWVLPDTRKYNKLGKDGRGEKVGIYKRKKIGR
jgi:hypothetical protein